MSGKNIVIEELEALRQRMEELYMRNFQEGSEEGGEPVPQDWVPTADIINSEKELIFILDLPGVLDRDLQVECRADRLLVYGTRHGDLPDGAESVIERPKGAFSRIFGLPCPIQQDAIRAELKRGVLRIIVPRLCSQNERPQRVVVRQED